jgi:hypothetical protein
MIFGNNGRSGILMSKVTTRELVAVEAEQNHRGRCFPKDTSKREISHALYETD